MKYILIALDAVVCAAGFAYFFYPLLLGLFSGVLWLLLPSRRATIAALFESGESDFAPGSMPVFVLTFIWLFAVWTH